LGRLATIANIERGLSLLLNICLSCNPLLFLLQCLHLPTTLSRSSAKSFEDAGYFLFEEALRTSKGRSVN
jgi:hypothetical protein